MSEWKLRLGDFILQMEFQALNQEWRSLVTLTFTHFRTFVYLFLLATLSFVVKPNRPNPTINHLFNLPFDPTRVKMPIWLVRVAICDIVTNSCRNNEHEIPWRHLLAMRQTQILERTLHTERCYCDY